MSSENIPWEYHAWDLKNHLIETGKIKIDLNRFADALIDLDKAIDVYPKDSIIFIENGKSKESNKDFIGALNDYDRATKFSLIYTYRGYVKSRIGDIKGAVKDYEKAETLKKKYYYSFESFGYPSVSIILLTFSKISSFNHSFFIYSGYTGSLFLSTCPVAEVSFFNLLIFGQR